MRQRPRLLGTNGDIRSGEPISHPYAYLAFVLPIPCIKASLWRSMCFITLPFDTLPSPLFQGQGRATLQDTASVKELVCALEHKFDVDRERSVLEQHAGQQQRDHEVELGLLEGQIQGLEQVRRGCC